MKDDDSLFQSELYFDMGEAIEDVRMASGGKETAAASAKLMGKALCNTGVFAGKLSVSILKNLPAIVEEAGRKAKENKEKAGR